MQGGDEENDGCQSRSRNEKQEGGVEPACRRNGRLVESGQDSLPQSRGWLGQRQGAQEESLARVRGRSLPAFQAALEMLLKPHLFVRGQFRTTGEQLPHPLVAAHGSPPY